MFDDKFLDGFVKVGSRPIQDLSWLDVNPEEYSKNDRLPNRKKFLNSKDQLRELWDHSINQGPAKFNLVPNIEKKSELSESVVNSDDVIDLVKKARLEVFKGKLGFDLSNFIRSKFARETIQASVPSLQKVAEECGLLGFLYVDPELFTCNDTKTVVSKQEFPEFVVLRLKCSDCLFNAKGNCLKFELPLSKEGSCSEETIKSLSLKLAARGWIFENDSSLESLARIRKMFFTKKKISSKGLTSTPVLSEEKIEVTPENVTSVLIESEQKAQEISSNLKDQVDGKIKNEVVKFLKKCFISGIFGRNAAEELKRKFSKITLKLAEKEVTDLFKDQGLFGGLYLTRSSFDNCDELADLVKKFKPLAKFLKKEACCSTCVHQHDQKCLKTNLDLVEGDPQISDTLIESYAKELSRIKNIDSSEFLKIYQSADKKATLRKMLLAALTGTVRIADSIHPPVISSSTAWQMSRVSSDVSSKVQEILQKVKISFDQGIGLKAIVNKVSNYLPPDVSLRLVKSAFFEIHIQASLEKGVRISSIVNKVNESFSPDISSALIKKALAETSFIHSKCFEYCQKLGTSGFKLNKDASLIQKDECVGCIFNSKVYCTKIGAKFKDASFVEKVIQDSNKEADQIQDFFKGSKVTVAFESKPKMLDGEIEDLDEFTIA